MIPRRGPGRARGALAAVPRGVVGAPCTGDRGPPQAHGQVLPGPLCPSSSAKFHGGPRRPGPAFNKTCMHRHDWAQPRTTHRIQSQEHASD